MLKLLGSREYLNVLKNPLQSINYVIARTIVPETIAHMSLKDNMTGLHLMVQVRRRLM